ncbi:unnamed protein product [Closterium sp. NIES-54]
MPPPMLLLLLLTSLVLRMSGLLLLLVGSATAARERVARVVAVAAGVVVVEAVEAVEVAEVEAGVGASVVAVVAAVGVGVAVVAAVGVVEAALVAVGVELLRGEVLAVARGSSSSIEARPLHPSSFVSGLHSVGRLGLLRSGVDIIALDDDAILAAMYALSVSAEGDCHLCVPLDPGIEAAALGASESTLPGTAPAEALHTFTLDSGASRCFFCDSTTLTPLPAPVPVTSADPSGGPVLVRSSTILPTAALPDVMVTTTTPGGQRVSICTCTRTGRHLATFAHRPRSSLYTLTIEPPQVAASAQVSASCPVAAPCSCRLLSHQTLMWHHRLGHPSLPRLCGVHSRLLDQERFFLLVVVDYTRYTTVFPLRSKGEVPDGLVPWIPAFRLQLRERFRQDLPVLRLHSDRGGEFSSDLLRDFCRGEGILQSPVRCASAKPLAPCLLAGDLAYTTLDGEGWRCVGVPGPPSVDPLLPQGPAPSGVSRVDPLLLTVPVEVAVDSGAARGAASGGVASWGAEPASAKPGGVEPEGVEPGVAESKGAESGGAEPAGEETLGTKPVGAEPGGAEYGGAKPRGTAFARGPTGASPRVSNRREPLSPQHLRECFAQRTCVRSGAAEAGGSAAEGTGAGGAGATSPRGARVTTGAGGTGGAGAASPGGARTSGTGAAGGGGVGGVGARDPNSGGAGGGGTGAGGAGASSPGGAGVTAGVGGTGGTGAAGPGGARTRGARAGGARARGAGARDPGAGGTGAGGAGARGTGAGGTGAGGVGAGGPGVGGTGAGDPGAGGAGAGGAGAGGPGAGGTVQRRPFFVPTSPSSLSPLDSVLSQVLSLPSSTGLTPSLLCRPPDQSQPSLQPDSTLPAPSPYAEQTDSLKEHREPESRPASRVRVVHIGRRVPRPRPPSVPGTHIMALRPSSVAHRSALLPCSRVAAAWSFSSCLRDHSGQHC